MCLAWMNALMTSSFLLIVLLIGDIVADQRA